MSLLKLAVLLHHLDLASFRRRLDCRLYLC